MAKTIEIEDPNALTPAQLAIAKGLGETEVQKQKGETPTPITNVYRALVKEGFLKEEKDLSATSEEAVRRRQESGAERGGPSFPGAGHKPGRVKPS